MDTLDKVQGAHSDLPISMDSLGINCPPSPWRMSMDSLDFIHVLSLSGKCGHCPLIILDNVQADYTMSSESMGSIDIVHRQSPLFVLNEFVKKTQLELE